MKNEKAAQRQQLIYEFGILFQPLEELANSPNTPPNRDYRIAIAKVQAGDRQWRERVKRFATFADDLFFNQEFGDISHVPEYLWLRLVRLLDDPDLRADEKQLHIQFKRVLSEARSSFFDYVDRVPIEWEPVIFSANTPFTSYLRIREAVTVARRQFHYFDRYLKPDFFYFFLEPIGNRISIRLVTTAGKEDYGVKGVLRISDLARQQFADYQLIEVEASYLHDRNMRVDDQVFSLGPGIDRAGMALTNFGPTDSSESAHCELDELIAMGRVVHQSQVEPSI